MQISPGAALGFAKPVEIIYPQPMVEPSPKHVGADPRGSRHTPAESLITNPLQSPSVSYNRSVVTEPAIKEVARQTDAAVENRPVPRKKPVAQPVKSALKKVKNIFTRHSTDPVIAAAPTFAATYENPPIPPTRINIDHTLVAYVSEPMLDNQDRLEKPEIPTAVTNIFIAKREPKSVQPRENIVVSQLSYSKLLWHAEKISINSKSLKEIYFHEKMDINALKTIVRESLSGGNVKKAFEKELAKNKLKFPVPSLLAHPFTATNIGYTPTLNPGNKPAGRQSNINLEITNRFKTKQNFTGELDTLSKTPKNNNFMLIICLVLILILAIILTIEIVKHRI